MVPSAISSLVGFTGVAFPSRDRAGTVTVDGCTVRLVYLKPRARCHEDRNRERCKRDYAVGHLDRVELPHEFFVVHCGALLTAGAAADSLPIAVAADLDRE